MPRFPWKLALAALPAIALTMFVAGCGKDDKKTTTGGGTTGAEGDGGGSKKEAKELEPAGGILKGRITLKAMPDVDKLKTQLKKAMDEKGQKECFTGDTEADQQAYRVGPDKSLGNVFVWVRPVKGTMFKIDKKMLADLPKTADIRQPHCAFIPHCLFLFTDYPSNPKKPKETEKTGQYLVIHNDATFSHNTAANSVGGNFNVPNKILSAGTTEEIKNAYPESAPVEFRCNIHPWMNGWMRVVDTPYYAISKSDTLDGKDKVKNDSADFGTYEIKNLPAAQVLVYVWHEKAGWLNKGEGKGEEVMIEAKTEKKMDFQAEPK